MKQVQVTMLVDKDGASDGVRVLRYREGKTYTISENLARQFYVCGAVSKTDLKIDAELKKKKEMHPNTPYRIIGHVRKDSGPIDIKDPGIRTEKEGGKK